MFPAQTQTEEINRVTTAIGDAVCAFIEVMSGRTFHASELRDYVIAYTGRYVAPSSPTRILQHLRRTGMVGYELLSRSKSLYRSNGLNRG